MHADQRECRMKLLLPLGNLVPNLVSNLVHLVASPSLHVPPSRILPSPRWRIRLEQRDRYQGFDKAYDKALDKDSLTGSRSHIQT